MKPYRILPSAINWDTPMGADLSDDFIVYCANNSIIVLRVNTLQCVMKLVSKSLVKWYIAVSIFQESLESDEESKEK